MSWISLKEMLDTLNIVQVELIFALFYLIYELNDLRFNWKIDWLYIFILLTGNYIGQANMISMIVSVVFVGIITVCFFHKQKKSVYLLTNYFYAYLGLLFTDFICILVIVFTGQIIEIFVTQILVISYIYVIKRLDLGNVIVKNNHFVDILILSLTIISILLILDTMALLNTSQKNIRPFVDLTFVIILLVIGIFSIFVILNIQRKKDRQIEQLVKHNKNNEEQISEQLKDYIRNLEESEIKLRAFRHDLKNIIHSLQITDSGIDNKELRKLEEYIDIQISAHSIFEYKNLENVQNGKIKQILMAKLYKLKLNNIPFEFECKTQIGDVSSINNLDLVRLIGISLDNAIEESQLIINQEGNVEKAKVEIMLYQGKDGDFEYGVRNLVSAEKAINIQSISKRGITTKKDHLGIGLYNVEEISKKYPNMIVNYGKEGEWFEFSILV